MQNSFLLRLSTCIISFLSVVHAFSVTVGTPTQCDSLPVSWTGGQAPFQIMLTPFAAPLHNYSIPNSAFSNGKGSYSISPLPFPTGTNFSLIMSDATGFGSGGATTVLTVGAPIANNNCNTGLGVPDFYFSAPLSPQQCNQFSFTDFGTAVLPATITGLIPGGEFISFHVTGSSYLWPAMDITEGTNVAFFMIDSQGRQGGVTPLYTVFPLDNTSCLNSNSPSSTVSPPSQTSSPSASSLGAPTQTQSASNTVNIGVIAGSAVGGAVLLALLIILGVCCMRKASRQSRQKDDTQEVKQNFQSHRQADSGSHLRLMHPESQSRQSAGDPFSQHLRHLSYTDSFAGSSSISSSGMPMASDGRTALPVGLAAPVHPGTHSLDASAGSFAFNEPHARFSQIQPSRLSSNVDSMSAYGDAGSSLSFSSRQMTALGQTISESYIYPYQTHPTQPIQPVAPLHDASAVNFAVSGPQSSLATQAAHPSSNLDAGSSSIFSPAGGMGAGDSQAATSASPHVIVHTDIEDAPASSAARDVVELPPQYTDRHVIVLQPPTTTDQKAVVS